MPRQIHHTLTEARIAEACERRLTSTDNPGFCIACGAEADGVEPDARDYECEACGEEAVYGADELLLEVSAGDKRAGRELRPGDRVAYSAKFLAGACLTAGSGVSGGRGAAIGEMPHRRGVVIGPAPDLDVLVYVRWDDDSGGYACGVHRANLVHADDLQRDAMRAEHAPLRSEAA